MELMVDYIASLDGYPDLALDLIESRTFDGGIQLLDYRPRLLDAPLPPGPGSA